MDFSGWEKLSLVDFDDNVTTTLFFAGCNFRCPFCHNSSLVLNPASCPKFKWESIMEYLKKRQGILDAVCITGGEPTLMNDLLDKMKDVKSLGYLIKLDSNGSKPEVVKEAFKQGLVDYVAMDIKNCPEKYPLTTGLKEVDMTPIEETVRFLIDSGIGYEFRTTIIDEHHTEEDIEKLGQFIKGAKKCFLQKFTDSEYCISRGLHEVPKEKALRFKAILEKYVDKVELRNYD